MKRIRTALIMLMIVFLSSCETPIDNYKGSIVINKAENTPFGYKMVIRTNRKDIAVDRMIYVYKYDYERFNVGDTIK
jgi:hypothetical protein